jgi:2-polyprenyl-6-methoxyphenol hydroxylase-like FAD-dependent oxidoreductase
MLSLSTKEVLSVNIIIVGAGIGGLTLGNLLQQSSKQIHFRIFERDTRAHSRLQGTTLGLKSPGGLVALQRLGMYEEIREWSKPVTNFSFLTRKGKPLLNLRDNPHSPETTLRVPREKLRDLLLKDIGGKIEFHTTCTGFTAREGKPVVFFANGREEAADLVVACDGVNSVIRKQMIGDERHYLGISGIGGTLPSDFPHPLLAGGPFIAIGDGMSLFVDQYEGKIRWGFSMHSQEKELKDISGPVLKERALSATKSWSPFMQEILQKTRPEEIAFGGGLYDKEPLTKAHAGSIVLLGDAAHPMSPFRGEGANMAMIDALSLTDGLLAADTRNREGALLIYEEEMLKRTRKYILLSRQSAYEMHRSNWFLQVVRNAKLRMANSFIPKFQEDGFLGKEGKKKDC